MKLTLLAQSPDFFLYRFKIISRWLDKYRSPGPRAVIRSLETGFEEIGADYNLNPKVKDIAEMVGVLRGVDALKWAISAKKQGKIKKIVAGPNIVVTPLDADKILLDENIDLIIVPSQWVKDFYSSFDETQNNADIKNSENPPSLSFFKGGSRIPPFEKGKLGGIFKDKIRIWPAGVKIPPLSEKKQQGCLVYKKQAPEDLFQEVVNFLKIKGIDYKVIEYGKFRQKNYFDLLEQSEFMIYLQEVESQGLALFEAWARNVPTLVWNRGYFEFNGVNKKIYGNISAPYLTNECGMFFSDETDFKGKLTIFLEKIHYFRPREYVAQNFTDKIRAQKYLEIIKEVSREN